MHGFVDTMGTADPNDDREYFIACRSDGIHIIDATPKSGFYGGVTWSLSASQVLIPASNPVEFIEETGWSYLLAGDPSHPLRPVPAGFPAAPAAPLSMNWAIDDFANGGDLSFANWNQSQSYTPSGAVFPYPYTTKNATNREAVAWYDAAADKWYLYSTNTRRNGIWVIPLRRASWSGHLQPDPTNPDYWWTGASATPQLNPTLQHQHSIYLDRARSQIWVCDDGQSRVRGIQILAGGVLSGVLVLDYVLPIGVKPHDAMPVDDRLFVIAGGAGGVSVFKLPITSAVPLVLQTTSVSGHSCYFDAAGGPPAFWFVQEAAGTPAAPSTDRNFERLAYTLGGGSSPDSWVTQAVTSHIVPIGFASINSDIVHHIRGVGRTGYFANYNDGLSLASLAPTGAGVQPLVLGSYDTSYRSRIVPGTVAQRVLDQYDGCWDVFAGNSSGLLYAGAGDVGALAFLVQRGQINRYWGATPFPAGAAAAGRYPVVASPYGPPRAGASYVLEDASAPTYPTGSDAAYTTYRHTLYYSSGDPAAPSAGWIPGVVTVTGLTNMGDQNLDANNPTHPVIAYTNNVGKWTFFFPNVGPVGQRWFAQMVVEELVNGASTGRWSASRGTWIEVAQ